jgi:hypothetical protein
LIANGDVVVASSSSKPNAAAEALPVS